jgi:hypothetical protein
MAFFDYTFEVGTLNIFNGNSMSDCILSTMNNLDVTMLDILQEGVFSDKTKARIDLNKVYDKFETMDVDRDMAESWLEGAEAKLFFSKLKATVLSDTLVFEGLDGETLKYSVSIKFSMKELMDFVKQSVFAAVEDPDFGATDDDSFGGDLNEDHGL